MKFGLSEEVILTLTLTQLEAERRGVLERLREAREAREELRAPPHPKSRKTRPLKNPRGRIRNLTAHISTLTAYHRRVVHQIEVVRALAKRPPTLRKPVARPDPALERRKRRLELLRPRGSLTARYRTALTVAQRERERAEPDPVVLSAALTIIQELRPRVRGARAGSATNTPAL